MEGMNIQQVDDLLELVNVLGPLQREFSLESKQQVDKHLPRVQHESLFFLPPRR